MVLLSTASKGRSNEHKYKHMLEAEGFYVMRSAGSHGMWDLIALLNERIILVQVKTVDLPINPPNELRNFQNCPKGTEMRYVQYCKGIGKPLEHFWVKGGKIQLYRELPILNKINP